MLIPYLYIDAFGLSGTAKQTKTPYYVDNGCSGDVTGYITMVYTYVDISRNSHDPSLALWGITFFWQTVLDMLIPAS